MKPLPTPSSALIRPHARRPIPSPARLTLLSAYGLLGLATAAGVHLGSYGGVTIRPEHPLFWGLHIAVFPLLFALVWRLRAWRGERRGPFGRREPALRLGELQSYFPAWVITAGVLLFAYVGFNFFVALGHLPSRPSGVDGAPMSPERAVYTVRAFSGHWLIFYALPTFFFMFVPADAPPREDTNGELVTIDE